MQSLTRTAFGPSYQLRSVRDCVFYNCTQKTRRARAVAGLPSQAKNIVKFLVFVVILAQGLMLIISVMCIDFIVCDVSTTNLTPTGRPFCSIAPTFFAQLVGPIDLPSAAYHTPLAFHVGLIPFLG